MIFSSVDSKILEGDEAIFISSSILCIFIYACSIFFLGKGGGGGGGGERRRKIMNA